MDNCRTYPKFEADQVLTAEQLNNLFTYLDQQNRATRTCFIGAGIQCGWQYSVDTQQQLISIKSGCGITSEGYLLKQQATTTYSHFETYVDPVNHPFFRQKTAQQASQPANQTSNQVNLWRLIPEHEIDSQNTEQIRITNQFLKDKVLITYLEVNNIDLDTCTGSDCDERGTEATLCNRLLLVSVADIDKLLASQTVQVSTDNYQGFRAKLSLPEISLGRIHWLGDEHHLLQLNDIQQAYSYLLNIGPLSALTSALVNCYEALAPLVSDEFEQNPFTNWQISIKNSIEIQYFYSYIRDMIKAYEELVAFSFHQFGNCEIAPESFPKHLLIGKLFEQDSCAPSPYRHHFIPVGSSQTHHSPHKQLKVLFKRLVLMSRSFSLPPLQGAKIKVTPSAPASKPLGEKAIPYYFDVNQLTELNQVWNHRLAAKCKSYLQRSYHINHSKPLCFVDTAEKFKQQKGYGLLAEHSLEKANLMTLPATPVIKSAAATIDEMAPLSLAPYMTYSGPISSFVSPSGYMPDLGISFPPDYDSSIPGPTIPSPNIPDGPIIDWPPRYDPDFPSLPELPWPPRDVPKPPPWTKPDLPPGKLPAPKPPLPEPPKKPGSSKQYLLLNTLKYKFDQQGGPDKTTQPLDTDISDVEFFNIEGHLGKSVNQAHNQLTQWIACYNLPIKLMTLKIGSLTETLPHHASCQLDDIALLFSTITDKLICYLNQTRKLIGAIRFDTPKETFEASEITKLTGNFVDKLTGQPISNVHYGINNLRQTGVTTGNGELLLTDLPSGSYTLDTYVEGYGTKSLPITVKAGTKLNLGTIALSKDALFEEQELTNTAESSFNRPPLGTTRVDYSTIPFSGLNLRSYNPLSTKFTGGIGAAENKATTKGISFNMANPLRYGYLGLNFSGFNFPTKNALYQPFVDVSGVDIDVTNNLTDNLEDFFADNAFSAVEDVVKTNAESSPYKIATVYEQLKGSNTDDIKQAANVFLYKRFPNITLTDTNDVKDKVLTPLAIIKNIDEIIAAFNLELTEFDLDYAVTKYRQLVAQLHKFKDVVTSNRFGDKVSEQTKDNIIRYVNLIAQENCFAQLTRLNASYQARMQKLMLSHMLSVFSATHTGLIHLGGCWSGGTFILVYDDNNQVVLDFTLPYICCSDCPPIELGMGTPVVFKLAKAKIGRAHV